MTKKSPKVWRYHLQRHWLTAPPEQPRSRYGGLGPTWPQFLRGHFRTGDDDDDKNVDIDGKIMLSLVCSPREKYLVDSGQESAQYFCAEISYGLIYSLQNVILMWCIEVGQTFADCVNFLQIFGGVEDTHKTLVKKASHKAGKKGDDLDDEEEGRRSSSVYDSRSSLRRWTSWIWQRWWSEGVR